MTKNSAHATTQLQRKTIHTVAIAEECERREHSWVLVPNSQGKNGPVNQREDCAEAKRNKGRLYEDSGEGNTKIHPNKPVRQRENQPFSGSREMSRTNCPENWMEIGFRLQPHPTRLRRGGNHRTNGGRHRVETKSVFYFNPKLQGFSLTGNGDSLASDGRCKHYTNSKHTSHFRKRDFSRGSR